MLFEDEKPPTAAALATQLRALLDASTSYDGHDDHYVNRWRKVTYVQGRDKGPNTFGVSTGRIDWHTQVVGQNGGLREADADLIAALQSNALRLITALERQVGKEECPGDFEWSAFGAEYPDTVCANSLKWPAGQHPGAVLCDADDDLCSGSVPCPMCDPQGFREYLWGGGDTILVWAEDEALVPQDVEVHFHDAKALWWTATHPERGEERVVARKTLDQEAKASPVAESGACAR